MKISFIPHDNSFVQLPKLVSTIVSSGNEFLSFIFWIPAIQVDWITPF